MLLEWELKYKMGLQQSKSTREKSPSFTSHSNDWPWVWGIRDQKLLDWKLGLTDNEIQAQAKLQSDLPVPITENV